MGSVARRQSGMMSERDSGDHAVAQLAGTAFSSPNRHQVRRLCRGSSVEGCDPMPHFVEDAFERLHQKRSSPSGGRDLQPEPDLKNCY